MAYKVPLSLINHTRLALEEAREMYREIECAFRRDTIEEITSMYRDSLNFVSLAEKYTGKSLNHIKSKIIERQKKDISDIINLPKSDLSIAKLAQITLDEIVKRSEREICEISKDEYDFIKYCLKSTIELLTYSMTEARKDVEWTDAERLEDYVKKGLIDEEIYDELLPLLKEEPKYRNNTLTALENARETSKYLIDVYKEWKKLGNSIDF